MQSDTGPGKDRPARVVVLCHTVFRGRESVFGPAHSAVEYLVGCGRRVIFIEHSLFDPVRTRCSEFHDGVKSRETWFERPRVGGMMKHAVDLARTAGLLRSVREVDCLIGVDPLSFMYGRLAVPGRRAACRVFYGADYAEKRFGNPLLDAVYQGLDRAALRSADAVWSVSKTLTDLRRGQGVPEERNFLVPNSPAFDPGRVLPPEAVDRRAIAMLSNLEPGLEYGMLCEGLRLLPAETPDWRLHVVGDGAARPEFERLCVQAGLRDRVQFHGHLPHDAAMEVVARCGVGLAVYDQLCPWHAYRDSVKIREYAALGLPVISTPGHGLCREIEERAFGFVVAEASGIASAARRIMTEPGCFEQCRRRALDFAAEYSKDKVLAAVAASCAGGQPVLRPVTRR